jgi:16S rRNA (adenine1518-N6/adenine1519-N6)-dimethyltransferase
MFKFFAKKSLGQNFLINPRIVELIIQAAEINSNNIVLEVGPGKGILTKALVENRCQSNSS